MKLARAITLLALTLSTAVAASACTSATGLASPGSSSGPAASTTTGSTASGSNVPSKKGAQAASGPQYTIEQAISDRAQESTIAFDALGFLTGTLESDSFFPPGKVADFWGFQYLRDNDPSEMGHNTDFLTSASLNMLTTLTSDQRAKLVTLAKSQVGEIREYGLKRYVLIKAFRRLLENDLPSGTSGLSESAVQAYSATLYQLDGTISLQRAQVMGPLLAGLTSAQRASLDAMVGKGMTSWPKATEPADLQGLSRDEKEAVMTYAGDMFSWYAGSVEADTYFCPERHGTYFGSFYLKDAPAVGNAGYSIDTTLTGNLGATLVSTLDSTQAALITGLVDQQRSALTQIVATRRSVSTELRKLLAGGSADATTVASLMKTYGELDGSIVFDYATAFAKVGRSLTTTEKAELVALRTKLLGSLSGATSAYLFSTPISAPAIPSTDFLFK